MPTIKQIESAMDEMAQTPNDPKNKLVLDKLGLPNVAVNAWADSKDNPDDPKSVAVKNKIFDRITSTLPVSTEPGGTDLIDRFKVKNLIDRDPILQQKYLEKKGYITKHTPEGLLVRRPDELQFSQFDPEGIDRFDLLDVAVDIGQALAEGAATVGGASLGFLGGGVPGAIAGGMAAAGATAGVIETGKQAIAQGMDMREEFDPSRIGQDVLIGAGSAVLGPVAGKALKGTGRLISKTAPKMVDEAAEIIKAGKKLGIKPALRQLYDNDTIRLLEENLTKRLGTVGGSMIRKTAKKTQKQLDDIAEAMIGKSKNIDLVDVGENAKNNIKKMTKWWLTPIEATYDRVTDFLKSADEYVDYDYMNKGIARIAEDHKFNKGAKSTIKFFKDSIDEVKNLDQLKQLRTNVGDAIREAKAKRNFGAVRALSDIYDMATKARSRSLDMMIDNADDVDSALAQAAKSALKKADKDYATVNSMLKQALTRRHKKAVQSVKSMVDGFDELTDIDFYRKMLNTNDPKQIKELKIQFPETFQILREGKIAEIAKAATFAKKNTLRIGTIMDRIEKMPKASKELIFGDDVIGKVKDLQTLFRTLPPPLNPSGTSHNLMSPTGWGKILISNFASLADSARLKILTNQNALGQFLENAAETIGDAGAVAIAQGIIRNEIPTKAEHDFNMSFGVPNVFEQPKRMNFGIPNQ